MEYSENNDAPKYPDTPPNPGNKNTGDIHALLQRIADELAAIKTVNKRSESARPLLYACFFGLLLGFAFYGVILQGNRIHELETNQIKMKKAMKMLDSELSSETQRMDDLLSGEIPEEIPDPSATGNILFVGMGKCPHRITHKTEHVQPVQPVSQSKKG